MSRAARRSARRLRAWPCLLRVVEREPDDTGGDPLLEAVELADLDLGVEVGVADVHAAERDVLLEHGRARPARDHADLMPADVHAFAVRRGFVSFELEPDEPALGMLAAFGE